MKKEIPLEEYKELLLKICKAYQALDEVRTCLEDLESSYQMPVFFNSEQIDECQTALEKHLGWDLLTNPRLLGLSKLDTKKEKE